MVESASVEHGQAELDAFAKHRPRLAAETPRATSEAHAGGCWAEPEPLPDARPPVPPFALGLLPEALRPWIADIAERMQCPLEYPAVGAMVALAAVVGRRVGIRPKRLDDWTVAPNLWGGIIGRPGVLKTPALAEGKKPLERLAAQSLKAHDAAKREHVASAELVKARRDVLRAELRKKDRRAEATIAAELSALADQETPPTEIRYSTNDPTVEKLGEMLAANPAGVGCHPPRGEHVTTWRNIGGGKVPPTPQPAMDWPADLNTMLRRVSVAFEWTAADVRDFRQWAQRSPDGLADARTFLEAEVAKLPAPGLLDRRRTVLDLLHADPGLRCAWFLADDGTDPLRLIIAIRGKGAAELAIPRERFDPLALPGLIGELAARGAA